MIDDIIGFVIHRVADEMETNWSWQRDDQHKSREGHQDDQHENQEEEREEDEDEVVEGGEREDGVWKSGAMSVTE